MHVGNRKVVGGLFKRLSQNADASDYPAPLEIEATVKAWSCGLGTRARAVRAYRVATVWDSRAARLFLRLLEMVRSIMAPQLMHFHA